MKWMKPMESINCKAILTNTETTSTIIQTEVHVQEKQHKFQQLVRKGTTRAEMKAES